VIGLPSEFENVRSGWSIPAYGKGQVSRRRAGQAQQTTTAGVGSVGGDNSRCSVAIVDNHLSCCGIDRVEAFLKYLDSQALGSIHECRVKLESTYRVTWSRWNPLRH
jgi:hypothetical protein